LDDLLGAYGLGQDRPSVSGGDRLRDQATAGPGLERPADEAHDRCRRQHERDAVHGGSPRSSRKAQAVSGGRGDKQQQPDAVPRGVRGQQRESRCGGELPRGGPGADETHEEHDGARDQGDVEA
jgi:hypothetical protein